MELYEWLYTAEVINKCGQGVNVPNALYERRKGKEYYIVCPNCGENVDDELECNCTKNKLVPLNFVVENG
jgi:hypothetical protein